MWNDQSFSILPRKLFFLNRCHFENMITSSLEFRIRHLTSRFEANEFNFYLPSRYPPKPKWLTSVGLNLIFHELCFMLCSSLALFSISYPHFFLSFDQFFLKTSGGLGSIVPNMHLLRKSLQKHEQTHAFHESSVNPRKRNEM